MGFAIELITKIVLLGPCVYMDSALNILDMGLVVLGLAKYVTPIPSFMSNLRVIKLLRLVRLSRLAKLVNKPSSDSYKDATVTLASLSVLVVDMSDAMMNVMIVSLLFIFMFALVGMKFFVLGPMCTEGLLSVGCGLVRDYGLCLEGYSSVLLLSY